MSIDLTAIRDCMEGRMPALVATCAADGTPDIAHLSHVHFVDREHVALPFQSFDKTRRNLLENPCAAVQMIDPVTSACYRLDLHYLRTEHGGPLFERMRARLAGVAANDGIGDVPQLRGADIHQVQGIARVGGGADANAPQRSGRSLLAGMRAISRRLLLAGEVGAQIQRLLADLDTHLGIRHSMLLLRDRDAPRLHVVASHGYATPRIGVRVALDDDVIGVAARCREPIRVALPAAAPVAGSPPAAPEDAGDHPVGVSAGAAILGLDAPSGRLAVPVTHADELLGVLYAESRDEARFTYEDEDALATVAGMLGLKIGRLDRVVDRGVDSSRAAQPSDSPPESGKLGIRRFRRDNSIFIGDRYLIKGVAGAILWKLLTEYDKERRVDFSNQELRRDQDLGLPPLVDNLEARLILLHRRLAERCDALRLEKTGRGRFRLQVMRELELFDEAG